MKWTKEQPKEDGFYAVIFDGDEMHHGGIMILDIEIDNGEILVCEPGGDYSRSLEDYLKENDEYNPLEVLVWGSEPIRFPNYPQNA